MEGVRAVGAQMLGTRGRVVPPGFDRDLLSTLLLAAAKPTQSAAMNGTEPQIEIFKPFGEAFELMKKILFRPFDLKKWCILGFAAFLAGHFAGMGFSFPTPPFGNFGASPSERDFVGPNLAQWKPWLPVAIGIFVLVMLVLIFVLNWLMARGNFIFTDCIVRNRAAIAAPWREYRTEGNRYFLFMIAVAFGTMALVGVLLVAIFVPLAWTNYQPHVASVVALVVVGVLIFIAYVSLAIAFAVISYFMVPVMYIRRCRSLEAFRETVRLIRGNIGSFVLFILFGVVLLLRLMVAGTIVTCVTCCLAALPYVGTVILLPAFVWLRAFGLLFLRQFGPEYDVWQGIEPLSATAIAARAIRPPIES